MSNQTPGPKTPKMFIGGTRTDVREPIQVYCRIRPMSKQNEISCIQKLSPATVRMSTPDTAVNFRENCSKETQYTFSYVFDEDTPQKSIFDHVALPLIDGLLHGRNGLLFTYGITGSGKTFTMTGTPEDSGIMPRALDVLYNSIAELQAKKFVFKPDRLNGFEIQSEEEAKREGLAELQTQTSYPKTPRVRKQESEWSRRIPEETKVNAIDEDNMYAVFVTYVEVYNNNVYDLLDDSFEDLTRSRVPQTKLVREDGAKNMYVHGVMEVEVKSTDEAFEVFNKGQRRKRMAHNTLNTESSRSHSVFTIRLVQAPLDAYGETMVQDKKSILVSQLSFVDLAGSERTNRTNTSGQRLREAGNINNSLMTLRSCLEILRENQINGTKKIVPYRDSKLTHLFKNYFDGESIIKVIVCINPRTEDYDENIHVMKFAEMSQEVQVANPTPLRSINNLPSGRRRANQIFKQAMAGLQADHCLNRNVENIPVNVGVPLVMSLSSQFPDMCLTDPCDDMTLKNLLMFLELQVEKKKKNDADVQLQAKAFRDNLKEFEAESIMMKHQLSLASADIVNSKEKVVGLEAQVNKLEAENNTIKRQLSGYERIVKRLQEEIKEKELVISKRVMDRERDKQKFQSKIAQTTEKLNLELEMKLTDHKRKVEMQMRNKDKKLQQVKRILSDESLSATPRSGTTAFPYDPRMASTESLLLPSVNTPSTITTRRKVNQYQFTPRPTTSAAVSNPRHRRSRSVSDDRWLDHRPQHPVPLNTVLQPVLKKRKSVSKLTELKDVANAKTSKYCLTTQEQDSEGDLETHIYKGDVVPTCGGGAQVILNDVEILKQKSPSSSPTRKRSGNIGEANVEDKCGIAIEGHGKRHRH